MNQIAKFTLSNQGLYKIGMSKKPTMPVLAKKYNISYEQLKGLKRKGYDIYNEEEVRTGMKERSRAKIAITKELPQDLKQELNNTHDINNLLSTLKDRILNATTNGDFMETKKAAECVKLFVDIDIKNKDLISKKLIEEQMARIAAAVSSATDRWVNDSPAQLHGLETEAEIQIRQRQFQKEILGELSDAESQVWEVINKPDEF